MAAQSDQLLHLLRRFHEEGVRYILVGGHAVRLNGFLRNTEDIDLLLPASADNGQRAMRALDFLASSRDLDPAWFEQISGDPENIRIADDLLVDILFAANGETYESLQPHVVTTAIEGVPIVTLDIEGLLKTKTTFRDKDRIDREALGRLLQELRRGQ
ncbi:MAG: hypothetical protein ABIR98_16385 [Usitatibacter sp.]